MPRVNEKLTPKQKNFAMEYCSNGLRADAAYIASFNTKLKKHKSASGNASHILKLPQVRAFIRTHLKSVLDKYKDSLHYQIINTYRLRAFYQTSDIITDKGELKVSLSELGELSQVVEQIEQKPYFDKITNTMKTLNKVTLANREKSLEQLTRYMALVTEQIEIKVETNINTLEDLESELNDVESQLREKRLSK